MKLGRHASSSPGLYVIEDGASILGLWLRVGLDRASTAIRAGSPQRQGDELPESAASFDALPPDFTQLIGWMVDHADGLLGGRNPRLLLIVEWSRELLLRTQVGEEIDGHPQARSGLAICELRGLKRASYAIQGDQWLEVRQVPPDALGTDPAAGPFSWILTPLAEEERARTSDALVPLPPAVGVPPDALGLPLNGHLDRDLRFHRMPRWATVYRRTISTPLAISLGARSLLAILGLAVIALTLGAAFTLRAKLAQPTGGTPPRLALATLPMGLCTADSAPFRSALRCQVAQISRRSTLDPDCGGDDGTQNLQADMCGLLDREKDGALVSPLGTLDGPLRDAGELALSQACFKMLGSPPSYALDSEGPGSRWGDPDRLLRGENALSALADLTSQIEAACTDSTARLRAEVQGAVLATHVGAQTPAEPARLRAAAVSTVSGDLPDALRPCLEGGSQAAQLAVDYGDICEPSDASRARAFAILEGQRPDDTSLADRYLRARYGELSRAAPKDGLWSCHLSLSGARPQRLPDSAPGAWGALVPIPAVYGARVGAQSELILDAALVGINSGQDLGVCWRTLDELLADFPLVHPLLGELDAEGWPVEAQQLCGQVCRAAFGPDRVDTPRLTPSADLEACLSRRDPTDAAPTFPPLALPWSGQTRAVPPASSPGRWISPSAAQICGFHVLAQGGLDLGRKDWLPAGLTGPGWAGEFPADVAAGTPAGVAGSPDGEAATAARQFQGTSADPRAGEMECGAVALQCFTELAFQVAGAGSPTRWPERWSGEVLRLARQDPAITAEDAPWCGLIHPYLAPKAITEELDATCRMGVEAARAGIADALTLAREQP